MNFKFVLWCLLAAGLLLSPFIQVVASTAGPVEFVIVIPSYNNEKWCLKNLESVFSQTYPHWSIIYINDCSTDRTGELVARFFHKRDTARRCRLIHNDKRVGAMANYYKGINLCPPNKVVATLDGDDWLADPTVLQKIARVYADKKIWATHGNFATEPFTTKSHCTAYPKKIMQMNAFRKYTWMGAQLRTFYARLFHLINPKDLMWNNEFMTMTSDLAFMFPILEMASQGHIQFMHDILYIVNTDNPISDVKTNSEFQLQLDHYIRTLPPYKPLKKLF